MLNSGISKLLAVFVALLLLIGSSITSFGGDDETGDIPTRWGLAASIGNTFDPDDDITFFQISGLIMWDYDKVWRHWAPKPLRFKVEATAGLAASPKTRGMGSIGMMALYYLESISNRRFNPYIEGGIGVIYTGFKVDGQGSRLNFNPQVGIGTELQPDAGPPYFGVLRLSHISNAGLHNDNRGVNSVVLMIGRFF